MNGMRLTLGATGVFLGVVVSAVPQERAAFAAGSTGHRFSGVRTAASSASGPSGGAPSAPAYGGGYVITHPLVVPVFWGSLNSTLTSNINGFYTAVTDSSYMDWLDEYYDSGFEFGVSSDLWDLPGRGTASRNFQNHAT